MLLQQLEDCYASLKMTVDVSCYHFSLSDLEQSLQLIDLNSVHPYKSSEVDSVLNNMNSSDSEILKKM